MPVYAMDWLRLRYQKLNDLQTAPGKKAYADTLMTVIRELADSVEQEHYLNVLAADIEVSQAAIRARLKESPMPQRQKTLEKPRELKPDSHAYQNQLLGLLLVYPTSRRVLETLEDEPQFYGQARREVFNYVVFHSHEKITEVPSDLQKHEDYVKILIVLAEELYAAFDANERLREANDLVRRLMNDNQKSEIQNLSQAIKDAEERGDAAAVDELLARFNNVIKHEKE